jgi:hypothetical protein
VVFFAHFSHVDASYKEKKVQKKIIHPPAPHETHAAEETSRWSKKEKRNKRKEEGRRKDLAGRGSARPSAGSRRKDLRWVSPGLFFFFFFFPSGDLESPLGLSPEGSRRRSEPRQLAATHLAASRGPAAETHGWVSQAVGFFFSPFR